MNKSLFSGLVESAETVKLIDSLAKEVERASSQIEGVCGPKPALEARLKESIDGIGKVRGRPLFYNYVGSGLGRGPYVELEDGSVKLDLINGIGIQLFGHSHPKLIRAALRGSLSDVVFQGNLQPNIEYFKLSDKLIEIASRNSRMKYVWLSTCGTMANENALKMTRQKREGARMIVTFSNAFAGRSTMMTEITDNPAFKVNMPNYNEVLRLPFYSPQDPADKTLNVLKEHVAKHGKNICCFVFEPMLGEGGYRAANKAFFEPLLDFCKSQNIPIWADEIQTFARTGEFFAYETYGIGKYIDVCTIAKTAQSGATLYVEDLKPDPGLLGGTFSGSSSAMTVGLEILNMMDKDGYLGAGGKVKQIHADFVAMLNTLNETTCKGLLREAGGLGLMVAVTPLDGSKEKQLGLLKDLYSNGLICFGCGKDPYRIRFLLPAILIKADIEVARGIIEKSILGQA